MNSIETLDEFWEITDNMRSLAKMADAMSRMGDNLMALCARYSVETVQLPDGSKDLSSTLGQLWARLAYLVSTTPNDLL